MKLGLYSITYLGIWYRDGAVPLAEVFGKAREQGYSGAAARNGWNPPLAIAASSASRLVRDSSQESVTWPIRFAFADSRPSAPSSVWARRITQRSQRMPLTWIVSDWTATSEP